MTTIDQLLTGDRTRADAVVSPTLDRPTRTSQDELAERAGHLRDQTRFLVDDVAGVHDEALEIQLESRTDEAAKRAVTELLAELAGLGFAWREIARLTGVSVPAVRKWRLGGQVSGPNRRAVARLLAFADVLRSDHLVQDVSSWMEIPIGGSSSTGIDVYVRGDTKLLLLHAAGHISSEELLDRFEPAWRSAVDDRFEIASGSDGEPIIRLKAPDRP